MRCKSPDHLLVDSNQYQAYLYSDLSFYVSVLSNDTMPYFPVCYKNISIGIYLQLSIFEELGLFSYLFVVSFLPL